MKLTQLVPKQRIGAGKPGSPQSMEELKNHPFWSLDHNKRDRLLCVSEYYTVPIPTSGLAGLNPREKATYEFEPVLKYYNKSIFDQLVKYHQKFND